MKLKIIYRINLKMSPGKLAAQAVHAAFGLVVKYGSLDPNMSVVVLQCTDKKFDEIKASTDCYVVHDAGHTELAPHTQTCLAYYEEES